SWSSTADEAERLLEESDYDLFIVDYTLPGLGTGMDLWNKCRRRYPGTPFLMISGIPVQEYLRISGREEMAPAFLPKPFSLRDLKGALESLTRATARAA